MKFQMNSRPDLVAQRADRMIRTPVPAHLRLLALATLLCFAASMFSGEVGTFFGGLRWLVFVALLVATTMLIYKLAQRGLLWRLRNKLVLTYLLIGLAPVVLFFLLVFAAAYTAAGQFAIHLATARLEEQLSSIAQDNRSVMRHAMDLMPNGDVPPLMRMPEVEERLSANGPPGLQMAMFRDMQSVDVLGMTGHRRTPLGFEHWLSTGPLGSFRTIVLDGSLLYLVVTDRVRLPADHILTIISSVPLNRQRLELVAANLGRVDLLPGLETQSGPEDKPAATDAPLRITTNAALRQSRISGGSPPPAANFLDLRVRFFSTIPVRDWETGTLRGVPMNVESRPSLLYNQLFAAALTGRNTDTVSIAFFAVCFLFATIEGLALYAGLRLSSTITQSVEDLYAATLSIDRGDLNHRIAVEQDDQLADLSRSFNRMSSSLGRLIEEQKEKERIESELTIAQEVQANLFPRGSVSIPSLELHGLCRPARTVSGDYYDFLLFEKEERKPDGSVQTETTGLGIALGDISGKGISAALLMATLHSAVRAYRFASEELLAPVSSSNGEQAETECSELFESPSKILGLLNRHLYRSTTPEKYATLFLAHYDRAASKLTYANAGQLPPFVLRTGGETVRLERGGTVVGLMDDMTYDEETVLLRCGDILIAYSDGVTEPENDFGDFGEDRLIDVVREFFDEPLEVISAEVMRALDAWIGDGEQPDDITLVLARQV